ncbi:MAG: hypothetical protein DRJ26_03065 [Candidatus Methanomethylicota archaeon]|uniref:DUF86 domain-containing protein n=1 Tax=Thermoproteota archaeon TaxID=2056631 RepID=A0A497F3Z9_9CREN|nr:MAG: hypothetical protein DRJ26_03065 [Candidatus Verstraetearchaeota archaeon]
MLLIYLKDIVEKLKRRGCISDKVYSNWARLIRIRNLVVHNNTVADRDEVLHIGDMEICLREGQALRGGLDYFVKLVDYAVDSYRYTLEALPTCEFGN